MVTKMKEEEKPIAYGFVVIAILGALYASSGMLYYLLRTQELWQAGYFFGYCILGCAALMIAYFIGIACSPVSTKQSGYGESK